MRTQSFWPSLPASVCLRDVAGFEASTPATPPPHTPSPPPYTPAPHTASARRMFPAAHTRTFSLSPTDRPALYRFATPTRQGYTEDWSVAGAATQGVPNARVVAVQKSKKSRTKKAAYVVFCGLQYGVFLTWDEVHPLVSGVKNCIFRGYGTVAEANAAYQYAAQHQWLRLAHSRVVAPLGPLPDPTDPSLPNPLHIAESLDNKWYIVYRGITPGVYGSHLECQLNTVGVKGNVYESVIGRSAAVSKYQQARIGGDVAAIAPVYTDTADVFR
ncbi:hypothetical protein B0H16DRAFT_1737894 [Mycena metata]|uniref:Ribonuclease H1 N-terminal domain-containing protein n=1 Tax=Mycena metata TaxID=1033252 RepID=A0AAD7MLF8_9AGAR|nr:hypothetical protein B0H16DRAFT_1737894 [Mycena metata]